MVKKKTKKKERRKKYKKRGKKFVSSTVDSIKSDSLRLWMTPPIKENIWPL